MLSGQREGMIHEVHRVKQANEFQIPVYRYEMYLEAADQDARPKLNEALLDDGMGPD